MANGPVTFGLVSLGDPDCMNTTTDITDKGLKADNPNFMHQFISGNINTRCAVRRNYLPTFGTDLPPESLPSTMEPTAMYPFIHMSLQGFDVAD